MSELVSSIVYILGDTASLIIFNLLIVISIIGIVKGFLKKENGNERKV